MPTLLQDLRFAFRALRKGWAVTLAAVLSLALAIAGNTAVFSLVDAMLFRPLPLLEPERLVVFGERLKDAPEGTAPIGTSLPTFADLRERSRTLAEWAVVQPTNVSLRGEDGSEPLAAQRVTPGYFHLAGARASLGRTFLPEEGVGGARRVVMISEEFREDRWGEEHPLGQVLTLNSEPHEIVGVLPSDFAFLQAGVDVLLPLTQNPRSAPRDSRAFLALARLRPGATMEQVRGEIRQISLDLEDEFPEVLRNRALDAYNVRSDIPSRQVKLLFGILQGLVVVVLIIACVNIANLLLARGQDRAREIALRTALGAEKGRILRQLLTESLTIGVAAGALGLGLGKLGIEAMARSFVGFIPATWTPVMDMRALGFTLAIAIVASVLFGLTPALQTAKTDLAGILKEGHGRGGGGRSRKRLSRGLVVGEIALSMVSLGVGAMMVRSFLEIRSSSPGFEGQDVLVASMIIPQARYSEDEEQLLLADQILERVGALPGVRSTALVNALPQAFLPPSDSIRIPGEQPVGGNNWQATKIAASPGYLDAMDISLLQGRFFQEEDRMDGAPVAAVNRLLAESRFPSRSALGKRLVVGGVEREIVGVVANVQQLLFTILGSTNETVYVPQAQEPALAFLVLEATGDPHDLAPSLRGEFQLIDHDLTLPTVLTMEELVDQAFTGVRVFNVILGGFGIMALFLAALGTYGVLAYSVSQRRHEIGVRMAMGAQPGSVVSMISRQGIRLGGVGLGLGLLATLPLINVLRSIMSVFSTVKPSTLGVIAAVLAGVTMLASWAPARRAARVDPVDTFREE
jgi:putative ABC transport system permease protein